MPDHRHHPTLLELHAGVRDADAGSVSRQLCGEFAQRWLARHPGARHVVRDVGLHPPAHPTALFTRANYTPAEARTPEMDASLAESETLIAELLAADHLLLALPMYNFSVPSTFKAWLDNVVRVQRTFAFDPATFTFRGLATGKRALVVVPSAADYTPDGGPMAAMDFLTPYVRAILGFIGIAEVEFVPVPNQFAPPEARAAGNAAVRVRLEAIAAGW